MDFHVVGVCKEGGHPCVTHFDLDHPDDFLEDITLNSWLSIFLEELKLCSAHLSCFSVFNDDGVLCAFLNADQVLWFNRNYILGCEQDGLDYGNFYILCIDFEKFRVEEE